jgi:hypothetical protein
MLIKGTTTRTWKYQAQKISVLYKCEKLLLFSGTAVMVEWSARQLARSGKGYCGHEMLYVKIHDLNCLDIARSLNAN